MFCPPAAGWWAGTVSDGQISVSVLLKHFKPAFHFFFFQSSWSLQCTLIPTTRHITVGCFSWFFKSVPRWFKGLQQQEPPVAQELMQGPLISILLVLEVPALRGLSKRSHQPICFFTWQPFCSPRRRVVLVGLCEGAQCAWEEETRKET